MENEMSSENWSQPNENQPSTGPQPEKKPFFQQEWLQKTWLNVKLATWLKCFIIAFVLSAVATFIAPKFTTAQYQRQDSQSSEYEEDVYDNYESEGGWYDENESEYGSSDDYDDSECIEDSSDDYYESEEDSFDDYYECEEDWEDSSDYDYYYED